jgi:hypothetical protein
MAPLAQYM